MDTDTGGGHQSILYVDVVVTKYVCDNMYLFAHGANLRSEMPARTTESAAGIVFAIFRL
jgi:hypothetical protein